MCRLKKNNVNSRYVSLDSVAPDLKTMHIATFLSPWEKKNSLKCMAVLITNILLMFWKISLESFRKLQRKLRAIFFICLAKINKGQGEERECKEL